MLFQRKPQKLLALAFPYIEKTLFVSDAFLKKSFLNKGTHHQMEPFLQEQMISHASHAPYFSLGGFLVRALIELAQRGVYTEIFGKIGEDAAAQFYRASLKRADLNVDLLKVSGSTSQILTLVNEAGQKTICSYLGASLDLDAFDLQESFFEDLEVLFLDGNSFFWGCLPIRALEMAQKSGAKTCFFLDGIHVQSFYQEPFLKRFLENVDLLIVSEQELNFLFEKTSVSKNELLNRSYQSTLVYSGQAFSKLYQSMNGKMEVFSFNEEWLVTFCNLFKKTDTCLNHAFTTTSR